MNTEQANKLDLGLRKIDSKYNFINYGGCAIFAHMCADKLKKKGIKSKIYLVAKWSEIPPVKSKEDPQKEIYRIGGVEHVLLNVKDYFIDSNGCNNNLSGNRPPYRYKRRVSKEFIKKSVKHKHLWNPTFDRSLVPEIEKDLDQLINETL